MVNNFTNINKMNNQFSPQFIEHKTDHDGIANPGPVLGQAQECAGLN